MIRFLILAGYFEITMYLQLSGKLNQYINMHYSYLAYISMILSFLLAVVQLYIWMKNLPVHSHLASKKAKVMSIPKRFQPRAIIFPSRLALPKIFKMMRGQPTNTSSQILAVILPNLLMNPR